MRVVRAALTRIAAGALAAALATAGCGIKGPPKPRGTTIESAQALYRASGATREEGRIVLAWAMPPAAWADVPKKVLVERHEPHEGGDGPSCGKRTVVGRVAATQRVEWSFESAAPGDGGASGGASGRKGARGVSYRLVAGDGTPLSDSIEVSSSL